MESAQAVVCLGSLAHATRLAVFRLLVRAGPEGVSAGQIARTLDTFPNTLTSHLNIMSNAGMVYSERRGRSVHYMADYDQMRKLIGFLLEDCCNGAPEICADLSAYIDICR